MEICHASEPEAGEDPGQKVIGNHKLADQTEVDRAVLLFIKRELPEEKERDIDQKKFRDDPREQILELYDEFRPRLLRYLRSMSLKRDQAEEVIQETFMRLTTELLKRNEIENVQGWIVRVAHNLAVDGMKKKQREAIRNADTTNIAVESCVDPSIGPEEEFLKKERIRQMEVALQALNPQQRQCFNMRVQGFRYKDIGLALNISEQRAALVVKQVSVRLAVVFGQENCG
ncbi:RNA polymerase, sigma-24 subunit, ECF subfamily [Terriglobus saanensis SP1PR4]|uniref:RNA polymerase, sigma-24 subunit, ECF subfamily n=1 Tax=Terriglobus saanensis (strain ATCC BAA-1853 / DSM 23119 / SP1PR4) TaxID=401053 RepID=E8V076_TERSS|nr:RNA polymerase, sigma-24 subunit, ECF subfamily [Terriglobus saanensis SP1PR4]